MSSNGSSPDFGDRVAELWQAQDRTGAISDIAYWVLREALITQLVPPGQRLAEEQLARLFNVSRTPVREALLRLEAEGFTERIPRRGLVASQVTQQEIIDVYVIRESIDGLAAELAAQRADVVDIATLARLNDEFLTASNNDDLSAMVIINLQFHEGIAQISHNLVLHDIIKQIHHRVRRFPGTTFSYPDRGQQAAAEHQQVLAAIAGHHPEQARQLAMDHMAAARKLRILLLEEKHNAAPVAVR